MRSGAKGILGVLVVLALAAVGTASLIQGSYLVFSSWRWFPPAFAGTFFALAVFNLFMLVRDFRQERALGSQYSFSLPSTDVPKQEEATYMGRGFSWTADHTRELLTLSTSGEIERFKREVSSPVHLGSGHYLHGIGLRNENEADLFVNNRLLAQHTFIGGTTGSGKSRLMELLTMQAIERGEAVVYIDPKGDPDRRLLRRMIETAIRMNRLDDVRIFDLTQPSRSIRYNPLGHYVYSKQLVSRIVASLPKEGDSAAFRDFAYKVVNAVVNAMDALSMKITLTKVYDYSDDVSELIRQFIKCKYSDSIPDVDRADVVRELIPKYEELIGQGVIEASPELEDVNKIAKHPKEHYQKMITSLFPLFSKLCTGPDRALLSNADTEEEELSWDFVDKRKQIVYFYLASNSDVERASAVGRMALLDIQSYLGVKYAHGSIETNSPMNIFVDELHAVLTDEYVSIINQARGAGFRVTMGTQSFADLEHVLGSKAAGKRVVANANVMIQLHVEEYEDAEVFASRCGKRLVSLPQKSVSYEPALLKSGNCEVEDFRVSMRQGETLMEVDLVPPWAVQELPVGHYFARWGGDVYKGRFPFLPEPTVTERDLTGISRGRIQKVGT